MAKPWGNSQSQQKRKAQSRNEFMIRNVGGDLDERWTKKLEWKDCRSECSTFSYIWRHFPGGSAVKNLPDNAGDAGLIPSREISLGEGNGNTLQYSCLGNPMDRGVCQATVRWVAKNQKQLIDWAVTIVLYMWMFNFVTYISQSVNSVTQSCLTLCNPMDYSTPGLPVHHEIPEYTQLMSTESVMPSNHLILCCPLLPPPTIFPSIRVFSIESVLRIRWPKYWNFSFSISPSNEYSGLISFKMDWMDLLAIQVTLKSLLQHHSSKASILQCSVFFIVQLSHPHMTMEKP